MAAAAYPVHVEAVLDARLSRWLWLVKWLLVIPHYVVLFFLWLSFGVLSLVAFFGILFTGRYPRAIFDFNVGVLRWSWRVAYYAYGALGTDRYPPFTLAEVPDYPAHFEIEYPAHLSRGLVLVKWWLLAIPHYLVVAFFVGSSGLFIGYTVSDGNTLVAGGGLIGLLVVIAAVVLLFTGRYPQQIFDFVLGLNRWALRVAGYAALMTDTYPPFSLELGGHDEGYARLDAGWPTAPAAGAPAAAATRWTAGRILPVVIGSVLALLAGGLLVVGTVVAVADQTARDDRGFFMTPEQSLSTGGYAIASEPLELDTGISQMAPSTFLGEVTVEATPTGDAPLFVGVASAADASAYLQDVEHATLVSLESRGGRQVPGYREAAGGAPAVLPGATDIWRTSSSGPGTQSVRWDLEAGDWTVVVMNVDGTRGVAVAAAVGAEFPDLGPVVGALFVIGVLLLLAALALLITTLVFVSRKRRGENPPPDQAYPTPYA